MIDDFGPTIKQKQKNIRKCFNTLHYSYQRILLGIMTNTNYWLVDMETSVIHLKSKELQDTQQVVGSSNVLRVQLLFRVVQYHSISVQSFLAAEPQLYLYLPDVSQTLYVH